MQNAKKKKTCRLKNEGCVSVHMKIGSDFYIIERSADLERDHSSINRDRSRSLAMRATWPIAG